MNRVCCRLADLVSRMLDADERDAVRGDLDETGVGDWQALRELAGLVARRQVGLLKTWRPWLALLGQAAPAAAVLSALWPRWLFRMAGTFWNQGVRVERALPLADDIVKLLCACLLLSAWGWTAGFTAGSVSRRTAWLPGLFLLLLVSQPLLATMRYVRPNWLLFAVALEALLILIPAWFGVHGGVRTGTRGLKRVVLCAAVLVILTMVLQIEDGRERLAFEVWTQGGSLGSKLAWDLRPLPFAAILWQFGFLFVTTSRRRQASIKETTT